MTSEFLVRNGLLAAEAGDFVVPAVLLKVIHYLAHRTKSVAAIVPVPALNLSLKKVVFCSSGPGNIFWLVDSFIQRTLVAYSVPAVVVASLAEDVAAWQQGNRRRNQAASTAQLGRWKAVNEHGGPPF